MAAPLASAWHGSARPKVECTARTHGLLHSAKRDDKPFTRSAGADPSAWQRWTPPQYRRGKVCGRARRRALHAHSTRPMLEVSLRVWRHTCTHDSLTHHAACGQHVRRMYSQALAVQCSTCKVGNYDWTSRGPLQLMVVQAVVQWFPTRRRARGARARRAWRLVWRHASMSSLRWSLHVPGGPRTWPMALGRLGRTLGSVRPRVWAR